MVKILTSILMLSLLFMVACSKEHDVPAYIGKWEFAEATPSVNVSDCYEGTWFEIAESQSFIFYNACLNETHSGSWVRKGLGFEVYENGELFNDFSGQFVELKNNRMIFETDMFGGITVIEFIKVEDIVL